MIRNTIFGGKVCWKEFWGKKSSWKNLGKRRFEFLGHKREAKFIQMSLQKICMTSLFLCTQIFLDLSSWFFMIQPKYNKQNNTIFLGFDSIEINLDYHKDWEPSNWTWKKEKSQWKTLPDTGECLIFFLKVKMETWVWSDRI